MTVSIVLHLHGFMINYVREEVVLCHMLWLHYKMKILNCQRAGHAYSKVNSDIFSFDFAVTSPNKKMIRIWRIEGISVVSENQGVVLLIVKVFYQK